MVATNELVPASGSVRISLISPTLDRRRFLCAAGGALAAVVTAGRAGAATPAAPAAAAGTLRLQPGDILGQQAHGVGVQRAACRKPQRLGFGAMRLTGEGIWGEPRDPVECRAVLRRALELGVGFIDTADAYGPHVSERLIAEALHPYADGLVIATKGGLVRRAPGDWTANGRPEYLRAACEGSLRRLRVERIDLYQLHSVDRTLPYEESIGELARLQREGKIRHIGVSNVDPVLLAKARGEATIVSVQNRYNAADRSSEAVLATCERDGIAFLPWAPLGTSAPPVGEPHPSQAVLAQVAKERGLTMPAAALAWLLTRSPAILPIPGTSRLQHLEENVRAARLRLTAAEMGRIG